MESYPFQTSNWRAQAVRVVDGDTAYLFVDTGFYGYHMMSFRFLDIDTPEMNSKVASEKTKAQDAKQMVKDMLDCDETTWMVHLKEWPLRIETEKRPDNFGRWLARIFFMDGAIEVSVNAELLREGLAVPYVK
jgi:endonuclease YncB( thermonuclease family)